MKSNIADRVYKTIMLVVLTALITFIVTTVFWKNNLKVTTNVASISKESKDTISEITSKLEYYRTFIDKYYIFDVNEDDLVDQTIVGYFKGLGDKYSEYITPSEMKESLEEIKGKFVGIGVYLANDKVENKILVLAPMENSPAEEAGIKPGDYILKVDGNSYKGEEMSEACDKLQAEAGTYATVTIERDGEVFDLQVERRVVQSHYVHSKIFDDNIGYLEIESFDDGTYKDFVEKYNELKEQGITSLIIDLRDNGGGIVDEAVDIADLFVDKDKTLLITKSKNKDEVEVLSKKAKEIDIPVVLLVNGNTASASEILTMTLKENVENLKIVGTKTYGKGVIQTIFSLKDGGGIKLTTEEYFSPSHEKIHEVGVTPDYELEFKLPAGVSKYLYEDKDDNQLQKAIELLK